MYSDLQLLIYWLIICRKVTELENFYNTHSAEVVTQRTDAVTKVCFSQHRSIQSHQLFVWQNSGILNNRLTIGACSNAIQNFYTLLLTEFRHT